MKKRISIGIIIVLSISALLAGCGTGSNGNISEHEESETVRSDTTLTANTEDIGARNEQASGEEQSPERQEANSEDTGSDDLDGSDPSDNELGWDGEWVGDGVTVIISGSDSDFPSVEFEDEVHNATLDEASIEGNTLTGVYRITLEMYADTDDAENLPEQEWTIVMVKDGGTASYHRETVLTWFNLNDDGTYGHTVTKENSASLQKVYKTEN